MSQMQQEQSKQLQQWQQGSSIIRVNADNSNKKVVVLFWSIFLFLLIIIFATSNFTPYTFVFKSNRSELQDTQQRDCVNPVVFEERRLACLPFSIRNPKLGLVMRNLSPLNQFAQINLVMLPNNIQSQSIQIKQKFSIELMSLKRTLFTISNTTKQLGFEKGEDIKVINNIEFDTKNYKLTKVISHRNIYELGYQINLGYYRQFKTKDALLIVTFQNTDWQLFKNYNVFLMAILINDNYTKFIMIMRGVFLGIMALSTSFYISKAIMARRSSQQNMVIIISVAIILFNDPYYFIGVFFPNVFSIFIETLFVSVFFIALFACWIYMLQKINAESRGKQLQINGCKKWVSIIIFIDFFVIIFAFNYQIAYYAYTDSPIIPAHSVFSFLWLIAIIFFGALFSYILYLYANIASVWGDVVWRNKLYLTFNIFFVCLILLFVSLGWFSLYDESSQKFQILYASMNIYVLYLQYMYFNAFGMKKDHLHQEMREVDTVSITMHNEIEVSYMIDLDKQNKQSVPSEMIEKQLEQ